MNPITSPYKYKTALLIDDNDIDNFINRSMLEANRFAETIHVSINGEAALNLIHELPGNSYPDVVLVDLNMPVMNGFEFIAHFKTINDEHPAKARIVVLTSSIHEEDRLMVEKMDSEILLIRKPLSVQALRDI